MRFMSILWLIGDSYEALGLVSDVKKGDDIC